MLGFVLEASTVMFLLDRWLSVESLFILALDLLQMLFPLIHLSVRGLSCLAAVNLCSGHI